MVKVFPFFHALYRVLPANVSLLSWNHTRARSIVKQKVLIIIYLMLSIRLLLITKILVDGVQTSSYLIVFEAFNSLNIIYHLCAMCSIKA